MTLYRIDGAHAVAWAGEAIGNTRYPADIETLWSDADLAAIGLYRPVGADAVPDGKVVTGSSVEIVNGVPKVVNTLGDPSFAPLTKRQVCAALINAGLTDDPNGFVLWCARDDPRRQGQGTRHQRLGQRALLHPR